MDNRTKKADKKKRQRLITDIISNYQVKNQDDLVKHLKKYDIKGSSQASVSRDIQEMNIIKDDDGFYVLSTEAMIIHHRSRLNQIFRYDVKALLPSPHTMAIKTRPGYARSTATLIESIFRDEFFGTISGDDCVLVIASGENCEKLKTALSQLQEFVP